MKYRLEILINRPRSGVWKLFSDYGKIHLWQPSIVKIEPVSGIPGQPGAVSKWIYKSQEREFFLTEKVIAREEPTHFESVFENEFAENTVDNRFTEQGNQTLWVAETRYRFRTPIMILMGPFVKNRYVLRSQKDMERFKELTEKMGDT